jgi:uncharacterized protein YbaP (TraB family)
MKKISLIFIIAFSFLSNAQNLEKSLLWKVYGNGVKDTSYLYGTIHLIEKKDFALSKTLKNRFKKTDALIMEINLEMDEATKTYVRDNALYPGGKTIQNYLSAEDFAFFQSYLKDTLKLGAIKTKLCEMMRPFYIQAIIMSAQMDSAVSYESTFNKMAKKKEKLGLETMQEQMAIIAGGELQTQVDELIRQLKSGELKADGELAKLVALYKLQDVQGLYDEMVNSMAKEGGKMAGVSKEDFLDNRNKRWIPKLAKLMKTKSIFIAVGAGHLAGENGVIQLLKNQGYIVEPVKQ